MTNADKKKWLNKLRIYWQVRDAHYTEFRKQEWNIEKRMKKETGEELEFFYTDEGSCVGIGHSDYNRRSSKKKNYFPLFHDLDLMKQGGCGKP